MKRHGFIFLFSIITSLTALSQETFASCGCEPSATMNEAKMTSSHVMLVDILDKTRILLPLVEPEYGEFLLKVRVTRSWKGRTPRFMYIRTPQFDKDCGIDLKIGKSYLVYAQGNKVPLVTACSRTKPASSEQAQLDMKNLGEAFIEPYEKLL